MSNEDLACLVLGRQLTRMVSDLVAMAMLGNGAYIERGFTYLGSPATIIVCTPEVAEAAKRGIAEAFRVESKVYAADGGETKQ